MIDYIHPREDLARVPLTFSKKILTKVNGFDLLFYVLLNIAVHGTISMKNDSASN
jgi:hypothetical protein